MSNIKENVDAARTKITVEKFDSEGNSLGMSVFEDANGIMMLKLPADQQNHPGYLATEGMISGKRSDLTTMASSLKEELDNRGLLGGSLMDILNDMFNGKGPEGEGHEHQCESCDVKGFCELDPAVEYRAANNPGNDEKLN